MICVRVNPHTTRGKYRGGFSGVDSDGVLGVATNLLGATCEGVIAHAGVARFSVRPGRHSRKTLPPKNVPEPLKPQRSRNSHSKERRRLIRDGSVVGIRMFKRQQRCTTPAISE